MIVYFLKKDNSNSWENVLTWIWAERINHEVRYFLNNSFKKYKSLVFIVK